MVRERGVGVDDYLEHKICRLSYTQSFIFTLDKCAQIIYEYSIYNNKKANGKGNIIG